MIGINGLAGAIADELSDYTDEVIEKVNITSIKVGKVAIKVLKATSPKLTGEYAKAWKLKTEKFYGMPDKRTIHVNDPEYRLAHLLEKSHATPGGGRTKPKVHIKPVEEALKKDFLKGVERAIENI